jgi:hypothetical protein
MSPTRPSSVLSTSVMAAARQAGLNSPFGVPYDT